MSRPPASLPADPDAVLGTFRRSGYDGPFSLETDGLVCCGVCGLCVRGCDAIVDELVRCDDRSRSRAAVVVAVRCGACGSRGALVVHEDPRGSDLRPRLACRSSTEDSLRARGTVRRSRDDVGVLLDDPITQPPLPWGPHA